MHDVEIPEKMMASGTEEKEDIDRYKEIYDTFRKQLAENKPKKGKGKKGGKKKKKKG